ncbi:amino acid adenylation protein [Streptomyces yokosukanensis]|uniref:Amino acid adenylation protein n=1 Tax=Streptomyces yokosukanensis TaxID=67386 RepID=A0A101PFE4_9ACTN|nr:amino acid adenylation domain-containing protein [Streptomyces yokosukanensis]KUN10478.1 amino acid adenylation protein [Streptomyces yokosukanensis]
MKTSSALTFDPARTGSCLFDMLERQAGLRPDATAVTFGDERLSYRGLHEESRTLGSRLRRLGIGPDACVGLFTDPSMDLMVGAWGVLAAGAAYLPLSPDYPEERLRYMIEDSGATVIVTQEHLRERLSALVPRGTEIITSARTPDRRIPEADEAPVPERSGGHLAYVIYTSGSTGKPKGVMIENEAVVSQLRWLTSCGYLGPRVTVLQKTPMSFDAAQWEILAPAAGTHVVMGEPGIYRDPQAIVTALRTHRITALQCVPTLLQALLETDGFTSCASLRRVFSGGEALTHRLARSFFHELPGVSLVNLYGPTEATINATAHQVDPERIGGEDSCTVPIGVPVDGVTAYVLDENLAPVDIGEAGELHLGGRQLARGYLGRPGQTAERFVGSTLDPDGRLYRTGDVCLWNPDGTLQFVGRTDNQVKLRGYRVELEEVAARIEEHTWVRHAATVVTDDPRTGHRTLVACVELNPHTAAVMDQGAHGAHHQSKTSKLQVKAQLSNPGLREAHELAGRPVVDLPGRACTPEQRRETFSRKTYRFYEGGRVTRDALLRLLAPRPLPTRSRPLAQLSPEELGHVLRWFGQFHSDERLLPKYSYASPGALYATQLYVESGGDVAGLAAGVYYYHPVDHTLVRVGDGSGHCPPGGLVVHFLGKKRAIEPVYRNNIQEVLEFETGHMLGVFEEILPAHGLTIAPLGHFATVKEALDVTGEDHYLGTFTITANDGVARPDPTELYVQAHGDRVEGLPGGQYRYRDGELEPVCDALVEARHVIAINQGVYERASFGISAVGRAEEPWLAYVSLGTRLHHLQRTPGFGFMSSGYSSRTGHPLPAARRLDDILGAAGIASGPSYFFLGGLVSDEQAASEGMREDSVHTRGPAEMIRDELVQFLPDYMVPSRVLVLDALPLTANGKIDTKALAAAPEVTGAQRSGPFVAPATRTEKWLAAAWGTALRYPDGADVSIEDEFFACGGDSLTSVALINRINKELGTALPFQVVFEHPRLRDLAARIDADTSAPVGRLVPLAPEGGFDPVFCWPGLGGYPMNLRLLSHEVDLDRPFFGVQAHGINEGETPYGTIREMARADLAEIRRAQPSGPYTLWGYSFGARVAFEAAWQLEQAGEKVEHLLLICPGNPKVRERDGRARGREASYGNPAYVTILFSVFAGTIHGPALDACLAATRDEDSFVAFVHGLLPALDTATIRRIARIVATTYEFEYTFRELTERTLAAPVTILKARGDDYSFVESHTGYSAQPPTVVDLAGDHYSVLREQGVAELARAAHTAMGR